MDCTIIKNENTKIGTQSQSCRCSYISLFCLFFIGSISGFILEGVGGIIRTGAWESHSATVWGPFCIIYGIGAVAVYLLAHFLNTNNIFLQFVLYTVAGAAVEFFGSLFQELSFGSTSWNYSKHFLNLGGRVSLKMALTWGALGIVFVRFIYPLLDHMFSKMKGKAWSIFCAVLTVFMVINLIVSAAAVSRWGERLSDVPANNAVEQWIDATYSNDAMEHLYPNMNFVLPASSSKK